MTIKADRNYSLERLFSRPGLLRIALTHKSVAHNRSYERFEFLGDAVIELAVRWSLVSDYKDASEGVLTRMKINLVRKSTLARCAERLGLREKVVTGAGFGDTPVSDSIASDTYEAVVGALFVDAGFERACRFVRETLVAVEAVSSSAASKTLLQEYCQARGIPLPVYKTNKVIGPPHAPVFDVSVLVNGSVLGTGRASSKKASQEIAAEAALQRLEGWKL